MTEWLASTSACKAVEALNIDSLTLVVKFFECTAEIQDRSCWSEQDMMCWSVDSDAGYLGLCWKAGSGNMHVGQDSKLVSEGGTSGLVVSSSIHETRRGMASSCYHLCDEISVTKEGGGWGGIGRSRCVAVGGLRLVATVMVIIGFIWSM